MIMRIFCLRTDHEWVHRCLIVAACSCLLLNAAQAESIEISATSARQMDKTITGIVVDETGEAVIGASVSVAGTTNGSITDIDGKFTLSGVPDNATINISYIGYVTESFKVDGRTSYHITLKENTQMIEEVIVIGYGTTTRKSVVGSVDQISPKVLKDRPVANVTQALQGASANLTIQQRSMNPNDNTMNINIRGISTINDNSPLIVIDGMVADADRMGLLNPNDIESVTVLKDAGSAAIYGSRSANGVILLNTKRGRNDMKPVVSFNASLGSQNPDILLKPLKGYQNALLRNNAYINSGLDPIYSSQEIQEFAKGDSEWFLKGIMKNALQQNYNLNVQGGGKNTSYMVSFGYFDQESNFKGDYGIKRYNFRTNLNMEYGRLKLSTIMAYDRSEGRAFQGDTGFLIANSTRLPVYNTYILKDAEGKYYNNDVLTGGNPLAELEHGGVTKTDNDHLQAIINAEFDIYKGLKAKAMLGYDLRPEHRLIQRSYWPVYDYKKQNTIVNTGSSKDYHIEDYNGKVTWLNSQFMLTYDRTFNNKHTISALAGFENESYRQERNEIKKQFVDPILYIPTDDTIIKEDSYNTPGGTTERSIYSWLGRVNYSYMDKYYAEVSARYDASSKFPSENRWGFFPSVSLGWRLSEEAFMANWKDRIGDMKLRGSFGVLGNQNVDDYQYYTTY
ncbi:MAG: SusC/RagA family TonB-linked outer membrane protein [Tannerellaceae bacterium]|nr:SusC/RagA family TonB-linked outer membrane protein [Tannerellaceae bacterium]